MAPFAKQANDNTVLGIDAIGFVQRLLLFDHYLIPTIRFKDIQILLQMVEPEALCELIAGGSIRFYLDSATGAEIGQARSQLQLTGNIAHLQNNEFSFATVKGKHDEFDTKKGLFELSQTDGISRSQAIAVANAVESALEEPRGLQLHAEAFKGLYTDLRSSSSDLIRTLIDERLRSLGIRNHNRLTFSIEEFVHEDFRVNSNLTTIFGLSSRKAREISLRALMDLNSVHIRLAHMNHFKTLLGMNDAEEFSWKIRVDGLIKSFSHESQRERQFSRVATIAGLGEGHFVDTKRIDLRRLIAVRNSEELITFRAWLRSTDGKSDAEVRDRLSSLRGKLGNFAQSRPGKLVRFLLTSLPNLISFPTLSSMVGTASSLADSFIVDSLLNKDSVQGIVGREYPRIFKN